MSRRTSPVPISRCPEGSNNEMSRAAARGDIVEIAWAGGTAFGEVRVPLTHVERPHARVPRRLWALPLFADRHRHIPARGWGESHPDEADTRASELRRLRRVEFVGRVVDMGTASLVPWPDRPEWVSSALRGLTGINASTNARRYAHGVGAGGPARDAVDANARDGATHVKVIATGSGLAPRREAVNAVIDRPAFDEVIEAARERGLPTAVHCQGGEVVDWCIESGVSTLEHGLYLDRRQLAALHEARVALTLTPGAYVRAAASSMGPVMRSLVSAALDEGIQLGIGTDDENQTMAAQLELLVGLGMSFAAAAASTTDLASPAAPPDGRSAMMLFDRDPARDVRVVANPLLVCDPAFDDGASTSVG
jgi:hypothetical protein